MSRTARKSRQDVSGTHLEPANSNDAAAAREGAVSPHDAGGRKPGFWPGIRQAKPLLAGCVLLALSYAVHIYGLELATRAMGLPDGPTLSAMLEKPLVVVRKEEGRAPELQCNCALPVPSTGIPQHLRDALIATEDQRFLVHSGIDWRGLARATARNLSKWWSGARLEGASTITQQLAKTLVGSDRTWLRKVRELILAKDIEALHSKDQIVDLYLNRVYFGRRQWGVEAASRFYFHKHASELSVFQSAMLVGMLKAPAAYDPQRRPDAARKRARIVLDLMVANGALGKKSAERAKAARQQDGKLAPLSLAERYYLDWIGSQLPSLLPAGWEGGGEWRISVSLDPWHQQAAAAAVASGTARGTPLGADQTALVAMDRDGMVTALVGGRDYSASQFNRATQALRQPGSTYKIAVYLAALQAGYKPATIVKDEPVSLNGWRPNNDDGRFRGEIRMIDAFAASRNAATVWLAKKVGLDKVSAMANRLGLPPVSTPSDILGASEVHPIDLTAAYATIDARGCSVRPQGAIAVLAGNGTVVRPAASQGCHRVLDKKVAREATELLEAVVKHGTGRRAALKVGAAGKTGTTQDNRDAWFVGSAGGLTAGIWFGNDQARPTSAVVGGTLPALTWKEFFSAALKAK